MVLDGQKQLAWLFAGGFIGFVAERIPPLAGLLPPGVGILLGIVVLWMLQRPAPQWRYVACIANELALSKRLGTAVLWSIALFIVVTAINIPCTLLASRFLHSVSSNPFLDATKALEWRAIPFAAVSLCVITPIAEELFFRRLLPNTLQTLGIAERLAVILAALFFAAIHLQPNAFLGLFAFGLTLSWQLKKHDLIQPILIHGFYNACVLLVVIAIKLILTNGG